MRKRLSTRTLSLRMIAASFAAAGAIFGGLAVQMAHGHDPALGAGTRSASGVASSSSTGGSSTGDQSFGSSSGDQSGFQDQSGSSPSGVVTRAS
jgi:hypothetical protein